MIQSYCGLLCDQCSYKGSLNCNGCLAQAPDMGWGKCEIAQCAIDSHIEHCGQCAKFPCDMLTKFSFDEEHGDKGARIEQCRRWAKK
ncbi:DUF3795 domain-containing protein [Candidatus Sumerlaeota bacterium]|nr:DUF3795 domain-containing protein [Candidatus Sumerlaeota bacterium]